jgi:hypothetical protein
MAANSTTMPTAMELAAIKLRYEATLVQSFFLWFGGMIGEPHASWVMI